MNKTYPRNWPLYNLAQTSEKLLALKLLNDAVDALNIPYHYSGRGRPPIGLDDVIKAMVIKVFNNWSARRSICDIQLAKGMNYFRDKPHFNIICKYMRSSEVTEHLHRLYMTLASPLSDIETIFAADATGFSVSKKHWVDVRLKRVEWKHFKKLHVISGVRSNVITKAEVSEGKRHESPFFEGIVNETSKYFTIKEICADPGYLSRKNCDITRRIGAVPYIKPTSNIRERARGSYDWRQMILLWNRNRELFKKHYHQRSNVESTFSTIKRKFLPYLRSKSEQGQHNELLCKVVAHNLSVLVNSIFELDVDLCFKEIN